MEAAQALVDAATAWMFPGLARASRQRMRRLLGLMDADLVRHRQALSLHSRLQAYCVRCETSSDARVFGVAAKDRAMLEQLLAEGFRQKDPLDAQLSRWREVEDKRRRRRKVGPSDDLLPHQLWRLPSTALEERCRRVDEGIKRTDECNPVGSFDEVMDDIASATTGRQWQRCGSTLRVRRKGGKTDEAQHEVKGFGLYSGRPTRIITLRRLNKSNYLVLRVGTMWT